MALNPNPVGQAIAEYLFNNKPAAGTPVGLPQLITIWQGVMTLIYNDIKANSTVPPGTFEVSGVMAGGDTVPVTGVGGPVT